MKQLILLTIACIGQLQAQSQWKVQKFGPGPTLNTYDIEVADGRNDSVQRIYVSATGAVYEWTFNNGQWNNTGTIKNGLNGLVTIEVGDGRGDGKNRVYFTEFVQNGRLFEATYNNGWNVIEIDNDLHSLCIFTGDGRNNGGGNVYVGTAGGTKGGLWEFHWNGTDFDSTLMHFQGIEGIGFVGDIRNDGVQRVCSNSKDQLEYEWNGISYDYNSLHDTTLWPDASFLLQGRNDGTNRVYTNTSTLGRVEYTYSNGQWTKRIVDPTKHRGDFYGARVKADEKFRLYTTNSNYYNGPAGDLKEFTWNDNTNTYDETTVLDATTGATAMIAAGTGRNDDTMRLYAPYTKTGEIYEITNLNPYVVSDTATGISGNTGSFSKTVIYPNPASDKIIIDITQESELDGIEIYTVTGNKINNVRFHKTENSYQYDISGYSRGIYIIKIKQGLREFSKKIIIN